MLNVECGVPTSTVDAKADEERESKRMRLEPPVSLFHENARLFIFQRCRDTFAKWCELVPIMAEAKKEDWWSILENYSLPADKLNIEDALDSELAVICVWCLFCNCPPHFKVKAIRVLTCISFRDPEAQNVSADKVSEQNLVLRVLCESTVEVQRHVCFALSYITCYILGQLDVISNDGIQDQLLKLVRGPERSARLTFPVLRAICWIAVVNEDMREKIIQSELSDSWFGKLMVSESDEDILEEACMIVACIACRKNWERLWDHIMSFYMPAIATLDRRWFRRFSANVPLLRAAAFAIMKLTDYASRQQILLLVFDGQCMEILFKFHDFFDEDDGMLFCCFLCAIKNILGAWDVVGFPNGYAVAIDNIDPGWEALLADSDNLDRTLVRSARSLVLQYRPHLVGGGR